MGVALQNIIDRGDAETMDEAQRVLLVQGRGVALQNIIDRGEAETMDEAQRVLLVQGREVELQNIIDRGEAETMLEASQVLGIRSGVASALATGKRSNYAGVYKHGQRWR